MLRSHIDLSLFSSVFHVDADNAPETLRSQALSSGAVLSPQIKLAAGDHTEDLISFITNGLPDDVLDATEIERQHPSDFQVASEPITVGALLTLTPAAVIAVARLVEKWLESRRQKEQIRLVTHAFGLSDDAGQAVAQIARKHAEVSIKYGMPRISDAKQ